MLDHIRRIVADVFQVPMDSVQAASTPETIESWDSIHHLELVLALEQEFGIQFTPEEIEQLLSIQLIVDLVSGKVTKDKVA